MDYLSSIVEILEDYQNQYNLNIKQLSEKLNISDRCVSNWLHKRSYPGLKNLVQIADMLNCSLDYLAGRSNFPDYIPATKNQNFEQRLYFLLEKNNLSSNSLAKFCGFGSSIFAKWKKGKIPKLETLLSVCDYFNVSLDYLVGRSDSI